MFNNTDAVEVPAAHIRYVAPDFRINYYLSVFESFSLTFLAELGDKTFIMLIILQLKANKSTIYFSALSAQLMMNVFSVIAGYIIDHLLYENLLDHIGMLFFFTYGLFLLGSSFKSDEQSFESELLMVEQMNKNKDNWENEEKYRQLIEEEKLKKLGINPTLEEYEVEKQKIMTRKVNLNENLDVIPELDASKEDLFSARITSGKLNTVSSADIEYDINNNDENQNNNENNNIIVNNKEESGNSMNFYKKVDDKNKGNEFIDFSVFTTIFCSMALSEFGDRTQMISLTMGALYNLTGVMLGSSLALVCSCTFGVYLGSKIIRFLKERYLNFFLGCAFVFYGYQVFMSKRRGGAVSVKY